MNTAVAVVAGGALIVALLRRYPLPPGVAIRGLVLGLLNALLAVGLAVVHRANRVLNFAQADLGSVPLALTVGLVVFSGWPSLVAFAVGVVAAALLGMTVEFLFIRRFRHSPRLILTVGTLGVLEALVVASILIPRAWGKTAASERLPQLLPWKWDIGSFRLLGNDLVALVVAPLVLAAVAWWLERTRVGTAVRASAERVDRAAMLGIPVSRLATVVWAVAAVLSYVALYLRAGILGAPVVTAFNPVDLLYAMAALVIGKAKLPAVALTAVAIGFVDYWVRWHADTPAIVVPIVTAGVLAALLLGRRSSSRADLDSTSSWRGADEVKPLTAGDRRLPVVRLVRWSLLAALVAAVVLAPTVLQVNRLIQLNEVVVFAMVGLSLMVLTGWAGQISLGQWGLVAIGAAVSGACTSRWNVDLTLALVAGAVVGALAALCIGLPALRVQGLYLAVTTLGFGAAVTMWLLNDRFFGWMPRRRLDIPPLFGRLDVSTPTRYYAYSIVVLVLLATALYGIRRSRVGRVIVAQRENERAAQSFGVGTTRARLTAFVLSGAVAGVAGGIYVHLTRAFTIASYGGSIPALTSAIIGGVSSITGVISGAVYTGVARRLPQEWAMLASGLGVLIVLLLLPQGIGGAIVRARDALVRWARRKEQS